MSQAEELLNGMSEEIPVHTHPVPDTDTYFVIDPVTRKIENTNPKKHVIMQYDHNSERCTFELPRFIDGHDMLECTSVTVNVDNIEVVESEGVEEVEPVEPRINSDAPDMTDLRIHPNDPEKVISSWLISRNSTQLAGILSFHIEYKGVDSNGNVVYEWSTDNYDEYEIRARKKNGEAVVVDHTDLLEQWRSRIFGAGDSIMANIAAEGEAQVAAVKAESETQQEAVELKGAQTLDSIPEDYTEVDAMADEAVRTKADAIVCEASGESVVLKDSSNDHIRELRLFGKSKQATTTGAQLAYIPDVESYENNGIVWSSNGGIVTAKGNAPIHSYTPSNIHADLKGLVGTFYLSGNGTYIKVAVQYTRDGVTNYVNGPQEFTLDGTETRVELYCQITTYNTDIDDTAYPMVNVGSTALPYEPYTGGMPSPNPEYPQEIVSIENPTVCTYGKNLLDVDATLTFTQYIGMDVRIPAGKYILSWDSVVTEYGIGPTIEFSDNNVWVESKHTALPKTITLTKDETKIHFYSDGADYNWSAGKPATINGLMLSVVGGDYESYKPAQTLAVARTLHGIPVTSGGNYTDENGQQWICDEVDLERGVYVQRVAIEELSKVSAFNDYGLHCTLFKGRSKYDVKFLCTHANSEISFANGQTGAYMSCVIYKKILPASVIDVQTGQAWIDDLKAAGTPFTVAYVLTTPIETPLTAEEITAFKALRTNYPNTTILNDAGAWMSVKYNADTKTYVENPKTLKLVDSSTGVVYELKIVDGNLTVVPV